MPATRAHGQDLLSVEISAIHDEIARRDRTRWPDAVVEVRGGRRALEVEFAPKGGKRLRAIVNAYAYSTRYRQVMFLVRNAALGQRILNLADSALRISGDRERIRVIAYPGLPDAEREALNAVLERRVSVPAPPDPVPMTEQALGDALGA